MRSCTTCDLEFPSFTELEIHYDRHHSNWTTGQLFNLSEYLQTYDHGSRLQLGSGFVEENEVELVPGGDNIVNKYWSIKQYFPSDPEKNSKFGIIKFFCSIIPSFMISKKNPPIIYLLY